jgi:hypothetical protein
MVSDDYFGSMMLGHDPYAEQKQQRIDRLMSLDSMMAPAPTPTHSGGTTSSTPQRTSSSPGPSTTSQTPEAMARTSPFSMMLNDVVRNVMQRGTGGSYQPTITGTPEAISEPNTGSKQVRPGTMYPDPNKPPDIPPQNEGGEWVWDDEDGWVERVNGDQYNPDDMENAPGRGVDGAVPREPGEGGTPRRGSPEMEEMLTAFLGQMLGRQLPGYGGPLEIGRNFMQDRGFNATNLGEQQGYRYLEDSWNRINGMSNSLSGIGRDAIAPWLNQGGIALEGLLKNGGAPDITGALGDIRTRGLMDIDDQMAGIREQYGQMGLGAGSDVSEATARGASRGIADINRDQSSLVAQILNAAQDRKLNAVGATQGMGNMALNAALGPAQLQTQLMGMLSGYGQQAAGIGYGAAGAFNQGAGIEMQRETDNINRLWSEFQRTTSYPFLDKAIAYSTGQPVVQQQGGSGAWGALGSLGGAAISILPWLFSSRTLKEDIEEIDTKPISEKLRNLKIYNWRYKGDPVKHIGPIAEEFQETFGVGDGFTLNPIDLFGVMLASAKEMARA